MTKENFMQQKTPKEKKEFHHWTGPRVNMSGSLELHDLLRIGNFSSVCNGINPTKFPVIYPGGYVQTEFIVFFDPKNGDEVLPVAKEMGLFVEYPHALLFSVAEELNRAHPGYYPFLHEPVDGQVIALYREHNFRSLMLVEADKIWPAGTIFPFFRKLA